MPGLYPLRFEPILRRYLWGGRRLGETLGKPIGPGNDYAESWEIVDHGEDQSRVRFGELAGQTLHQLLLDQGRDLMGTPYERWRSEPRPPQLQDRFPLLFKFLDCQRHLSVQVHPNDDQGGQLDPPDLGKTEAWVVLEAEPDSRIYAGLQSGVGLDDLAAAVEAGETESVLHSFAPQAGDCVFIPAGTVHALGAGLLIAEIQQASDTTYRLFDWNRVDAQGNARPLHVAESLAVTQFDRGPVDPVTPEPLGVDHERLVRSDVFELHRHTFRGRLDLPCNDRCHIVAVIEGEVTVKDDPGMTPLYRGETMLIPASLGTAHLVTTSPQAILLDMFIPDSVKLD